MLASIITIYLGVTAVLVITITNFRQTTILTELR